MSSRKVSGNESGSFLPAAFKAPVTPLARSESLFSTSSSNDNPIDNNTSISSNAYYDLKAQNDSEKLQYETKINNIIETDDAEDEAWVKKETYEKLRDEAKKMKGDFVRAFVNYGPPYDDALSEDDYSNWFIDVSGLDFKIFKLHAYLNNLFDPNTRDRNDFSNAAVNYFSRNANLLGVQMVVRAGASINQTNDMGHSALICASMMKHAPDKKPTQMKLIEYLVKYGADVNWRDKAGYCALDYCVMNSNLPMVQLLIESGALVRRDNHTFAAKRESLLDLAKDADIYQLINKKLKKELIQFEHDNEVKERYRHMVEEEKRLIRLDKSLAKRKMKRIEHQIAEEEKLIKIALLQRKKELGKRDMDKLNDQMKEKEIAKHGEWRKDSYHRWHYHLCKPDATSKSVFPAGLSMMKSLRDLNSKDKVAGLWSKLSKGGELELNWTRQEPFLTSDELEERQQGLLDNDLLELSLSTGNEGSQSHV